MSGRLQANTFPKTEPDLNNTQGTSDVVPDPQNKIENNFQWHECSKIFLDRIKVDVLITSVSHNHGWDLKKNDGSGFLRLENTRLTRQNVLM